MNVGGCAPAEGWEEGIMVSMDRMFRTLVSKVDVLWPFRVEG